MRYIFLYCYHFFLTYTLIMNAHGRAVTTAITHNLNYYYHNYFYLLFKKFDIVCTLSCVYTRRKRLETPVVLPEIKNSVWRFVYYCWYSPQICRVSRPRVPAPKICFIILHAGLVSIVILFHFTTRRLTFLHKILLAFLWRSYVFKIRLFIVLNQTRILGVYIYIYMLREMWNTGRCKPRILLHNYLL